MKRTFTYLILALVILVAFGYYFINQYAYKLAEDMLYDLEPKIEGWFNKQTNYKSEKIHITYDLASANIFKNIILENVELRNINDKITLDKLSLKIDDNNINIKEAINLNYLLSDVRLEINRFSINDLPLEELSSDEPLSKLVFNDLKVEGLRHSRKEGLDGSMIIEEIGINNIGNNSLNGFQIENMSFYLPELNLSINKIYVDNFENFDSIIALANNNYELYGLDNAHYQNAMNYYGLNLFRVENISAKISYLNKSNEIEIGIIELNIGRNDDNFLIADDISAKLDKIRIPISIFDEYINFDLYKNILSWNDELVLNLFTSLTGDSNNSSARYETQFGVEKLGSINFNFNVGGYTDDFIINSLNNPYYYETDEAHNDITLKAFDFMYIDEGLNELVLNEIDMSRQELQFYFDQTVSSSPLISSKHKIQLINAFENLMAGKRKVIIQFNSKYPNGIKATELNFITYNNFERYGEFLIKVE